MTFTATCDANKARTILQLMFEQSLPATHDKARVANDTLLMSNEEVVHWLELVLFRQYSIGWTFLSSLDDKYHICLRL